jgi:hypothetical protein
MPRYPLAIVLVTICVGVAVGSAGRTAIAASPYVVDGIALGASLQGARDYQCDASRLFPKYTWCRHHRQEKGRHASAVSTNSVLHDRDGTLAYVSREIRPAFFAVNEIDAEIGRLSARFGERPRETRLPKQKDFETAIMAVWGSLRLEPLEGRSLEAFESGKASKQGLLVDQLGDVHRSLRLGLPVYRLAGGRGYLWLATAQRGGRGYLRLLAADVDALAVPADASPSARPEDLAALAPKKVPPAMASGIALAAADLRPFLTPLPTLAVPDELGNKSVSRRTNEPQQSMVQRTRFDARRTMLMDAERLAAAEKEKARLAWARFEAEKAAYNSSMRVKWTIGASLLILLAVLALLQIMTRREEQPASQSC